jgi:hypothetical protein
MGYIIKIIFKGKAHLKGLAFFEILEYFSGGY